MATPYDIPQNFSTTLNVPGGINNSQTTGIVLTTVTGLPTDGGVLCFDWATTLDTSVAEYIEYTGISGNTLSGVTRGAEGLSAKTHSNACTIVGVVSRMHIKRLRDKLTGNDATAIQDPNGNEILKTSYNASAVNEVTVTNAATGANPIISMTGGDTNIGMTLRPKGSGVIVKDGPENYAADAGSNDTYAVTITGISAYAAGLFVRFKANTINTGAATINVNSLGAKTIKKLNDQDLADGDIESGQIVSVVYDGTNFQMESQIANTPSTTVTVIGARAYKSSATQSLSSDSPTAITLDAETYDTNTLHDNSTNNSRLTIPTSQGGKWLITGSVAFASNSTGTREAFIKVNGTTYITRSSVQAASNGGTTVTVASVLSLSAGDYVELFGSQKSGGALNVSNTDDWSINSTWLEANKLGS